jgi:hypothetical protein
LGSDNVDELENKILYLIDFGISRKYKDASGKHIREMKDSKF